MINHRAAKKTWDSTSPWVNYTNISGNLKYLNPESIRQGTHFCFEVECRASFVVSTAKTIIGCLDAMRGADTWPVMYQEGWEPITERRKLSSWPRQAERGVFPMGVGELAAPLGKGTDQ
jgi:hypothetical protein